jgi:hypothetical protein
MLSLVEQEYDSPLSGAVASAVLGSQHLAEEFPNEYPSHFS